MKLSDNAGKNCINILSVIISDRQNTLNEGAWTAPKNVRIVDTLIIHPEQIALINEKVDGSELVSDVLIICENQFKEFVGFSKMLRVLYSCEKHGAVVAFNRCSQGIRGLTKERYEKISEYLGDYRGIPYIESVPVLIKAEMFQRFGKFDEGFKSIEGALKEFSLRFNQYGWSTVRANCWNDNGVSAMKAIVEDEDVIQRRYPYLQEIEDIYYRRAEKASEHFADVLVQEPGRKPCLLFSLYEVPPSYNGTANYALKLLSAFYESYQKKYEVSVLVKRNADEFHRLSDLYPQVYFPDTVKKHTFHLGFAVSQILCAEHMDIINTCCLKYCVCMLDIISLRSHYLCKNDPGRYDLFRDSIEYADLMLSISRFSHDDIVGFFQEEVKNTELKTGFIYLGTDKKMSDSGTENVAEPFGEEDYFIVIGNAYKHKMIEPVLEILKDTEENFIVIGTKTEGYYHKSKRIYGYVSGWLDHNNLNQIIAASKGIIFPSVYEGFGLTLYDAAVYQKKIIVSDTQINLELKTLLGEYGSRILTYRRLEELKTILSENDFEDKWDGELVNIRSWKELSKELDIWIENMQGQEIDIGRLERRWRYLRRYQDIVDDSLAKKGNEKKERLIRKCISGFPRTYQLYRKLVTAIDKEHYGSH